MRRIALLFVTLLALTSAACRCGIEKQTVEKLDTSVSALHVKYLRYVEAQPETVLSETQKKVERDSVKSQKDLLEALMRAVK